MLPCRLRLLKSFSSLEIPFPLLLLTTTPSPNRKLSFLSTPPPPPPPPPNVKNLFHYPKKQRGAAQAFSTITSTTAAAEDNEAATTSLFSPYLSVRIHCNKQDAVLLSEALLCFDATSASMDESDSCDDFDDIWITSIFAEGQDIQTCISQAADSIDLNYIPKYEVSEGKQCDWVANIQDTFHPIKIAAGLWVIPKWRSPPDSQATNIILDPGLAFGTGEHPTTKMCLLLLHGLIKGGEHFLDYGTGSGVLGIAAVKMGVALSVGIDIDPQAVTSACQNVALNEIDCNKMFVYLVPSKDCLPNICERTKEIPEENTSNKLEHVARESFDIVIANILLNPLMDLAEDIVAFAKPGAAIGLSGILSEQLPQIKERYSQFLDNISVSEMDGWACLQGTRKII
ncbi:uncharacterized protein M6B38_128910 [Iris pallida]|uniref:ETFB lysine methyltransferase n=1 Tax=Iris pallida TaxID=29817 RepID=A0AAX6G4U0_IRIPA|nr:uncharacterized protein M6B38_128910 [Iris pallida]